MPDRDGALRCVPDPRGYHGLMERMARRIGLDLNRLLLARRLSASQIALLKRRCSGCAEDPDCTRWLDVAAPGSDPPRYCLNRKILLDLASQPGDQKAKTPPQGGGA